MNLLSNRVNKILIVFIACLFIFASVADAKKRQPVTATSWLVADGKGKIIKSINHDDLHSIASITKLMTAMVVLDANQDLNERIEKFTRQQHLQLALIKSNNHSADLLCENYPGGTDACVDAMNAKAIKIGMKDTSFVDGSGINDDNVSTSRSLVKLVLAAQHYPLIVKSSQTSLMKIKLKNTYLSFKNTNPLVGKHQKFLVSKTGYIKVAGGCIALLMETDKGKRAIIILGSKNTHTRIPEVRHLVRNY
jgi:D-alanyl-D-alanine endopeptidase (penicillin-binding protein 7)